MKRLFSRTGTAMMWVALGAVAAVPAAASEPGAPFARLIAAGSAVYWTTAPTGAEISLSVTGPAFAMRQVSAPGENPSMVLLATDGSPLADGVYNWEIRESFPGINDGVADPVNGRDGDAGQEARARVPIQGRVDSGVFTIKNGVVVDSGVSEISSPEAEGASGKEGN